MPMMTRNLLSGINAAVRKMNKGTFNFLSSVNLALLELKKNPDSTHKLNLSYFQGRKSVNKPISQKHRKKI